MNRRRSERVLLQLRVIVVAEIAPAKTARMDAFTLVVSAHGGLLEMSVKLPKGQKLLLSNPAAGVEAKCTVVSARAGRDGSYAVAFEFDHPSPQFWSLSFPPKDWGLVAAEN